MAKRLPKKQKKQLLTTFKQVAQPYIDLIKPTVTMLVFLMIMGYVKQIIPGVNLPNPCVAGGGAVMASSIGESANKTAIQVGSRVLYVSRHASERMFERGISKLNIQETVASGRLFAYTHSNLVKIGYYYPVQRIFIAVDRFHNNIITVIRNVPERYVAELLSRRIHF
jgi:hypothetical protein